MEMPTPDDDAAAGTGATRAALDDAADGHDDDPPPPAPVMPDLDACCGQGCDPCIFDLYDAARQRHQVALQAWRARHGRSGPRQDGPGDAAPPKTDPSPIAVFVTARR